MFELYAGCSALAQNKYLVRHNAALKVLFYEVLHDLKLLEDVPPWYSPSLPKPHYESSQAEAYWDIPVYAEHHEVRANRVDARVVDHVKKKVLLIEMSCPWIDNRAKYRTMKRKLAFYWLIVFITMTTAISSHVKDKNDTLTASGEDMIF